MTLNVDTVLTTPSPFPVNVYKKLGEILKESLRVAKNGNNDFHKYKYATEADILEVGREAFTAHNLVYTVNQKSVSNPNETLTRVELEITLVDLDSGEHLLLSAFGEGQDKGDKGIYKAVTGAIKYFLTKNLMISTNDDPENENEARTYPKAKAAKVVIDNGSDKVDLETVPPTIPNAKVTAEMAAPKKRSGFVKSGASAATGNAAVKVETDEWN